MALHSKTGVSWEGGFLNTQACYGLGILNVQCDMIQRHSREFGFSSLRLLSAWRKEVEDSPGPAAQNSTHSMKASTMPVGSEASSRGFRGGAIPSTTLCLAPPGILEGTLQGQFTTSPSESARKPTFCQHLHLPGIDQLGAGALRLRRRPLPLPRPHRRSYMAEGFRDMSCERPWPLKAPV